MTIAKDMMVNDGIRARELRLIGQDGEQLGVKTKAEALQIAESANLDLVLVAPGANHQLRELWIMENSVSNNKRKSVKLARNKK